jgi:hypothetical protein
MVQFDDKLIDHSFDIFSAQRVKADHGVQPITTRG